MKRIDLGQTLSLIANFGVIVGIGFLAWEIRQNTIAISGTTVQALAEQSQQVVLIGLQVPEVRLAFQRSGRGLEYMTPEDYSVLYWWYAAAFRVVENRFRQSNFGTVNAEIVSQLGGNAAVYRHPAFGLIWKDSRADYADDFARWVDENLIPGVQNTLVNIQPDLMLPEALDALPRERR